MEEQLAAAQTLKYAEELRELYSEERRQRRRAEDALALLQASYGATVRALAATLELRDYSSGGHSERVTQVALELAARVAPDLTEDPELEYGFLLHDIGKIGLPDRILLKPGPLDERELDEMRDHTRLGERLVAPVPHLKTLARQVVAAHHERWDGRGYPRRLYRTDIPLPARIFSIVDSFDAMTSERPYRAALPLDVVLEEIEREAGKQFDPSIAAAFLEMISGQGREAAA